MINNTEPIAPISLYQRAHECEEFECKMLEWVLGRMENDLDKICEKYIKTGEIQFISYNFNIENAVEEESFGFMKGAADLAVAGPDSFIRHFQESYKTAFAKLIERCKHEHFPVNIEVSLLGYRDKITHELEDYSA